MMAKRKKRDFYFFGFGNMAQAIYQRMDKEPYGNIYIIEKSDELIAELNKTRGENSKSEDFKLSRNTIIVEDQEYFYISNFDIFLLAVKPSDIKALCKVQLTKLNFDMKEQPYIISIAAGITTKNRCIFRRLWCAEAYKSNAQFMCKKGYGNDRPLWRSLLF